MKTDSGVTSPAAIVALVDDGLSDTQTGHDGASALTRARAFAEPLLANQTLPSGANALAHADGVAAILTGIGAAPPMQAAAYLIYTADFLQKPEDVVRQAFGDSYASLVVHTRRLVQLQRAARDADVAQGKHAEQTERVRKMLLAFSQDLRVVLLRLASRLQTLRWHAASRVECPAVVARETLQVFAPLASRLGIWPLKWELEDLSFRFLQPTEYHAIARQLDGTRSERECRVASLCSEVGQLLHAAGLTANVYGRPKHIYSIWKKMRGKQLSFEQVLDQLALRIIVADADAGYAALARVHAHYHPLPEAFDDYIARPKPNGYQSLHTVVTDDQGQAVEIQIRSQAMHEHAEHGVAAHWAYKEAGTRGYSGHSSASEHEARVTEARKQVLRQLLAWERDFALAPDAAAVTEDRIYVFTPQASVVELPAGATGVDFAYALHTELGHRCRGARADGVMWPLNKPLAQGQTVEVLSAKEGGPSLDWLNPELGFLQSHRARSKVRAWFNARAQRETIARGREAVEKLLQREGRTALKLDDLASRLGFRNADALFEVVGKDEFSLRTIEQLLRDAPAPVDDSVTLRRSRQTSGLTGGVLVVGVDSLLTGLAVCCRPAPPDAIGGFVTRGKGVAVHRADCVNLRHLTTRSPERVIPVAWGEAADKGQAMYPVTVVVEASDRAGLLRDITELFGREKMNVVAMNTRSVRDAMGMTAWITLTLEVSDASRLAQVLGLIDRIAGVRRARRK